MSSSPARPASSDIFCRVIDNYGDIGVCWRLARQLVNEHRLRVRLWVDKLEAFARICPQIDCQLHVQTVDGVEVRHWPADFSGGSGQLVPADLVIETFACHLPDAFVAAMAARPTPPVWINLDYLSAEDWVAGCHALPSPHPYLPLVKTFFFPGFNAATGGLLRERALLRERDEFLASPALQSRFLQDLGLTPPAAGALVVSLFAYANPALDNLLASWVQGPQAVCCLVPEASALADVEAFVGHSLRSGDQVRRGGLEIRVLPFVTQPNYDRLLWSCDVNFVRGEDSFVRAQWAAKPLVWHIYPQDGKTHLTKLGAFLDRYCGGRGQGLAEPAAATLRAVFMAWNDGQSGQALTPPLWLAFMQALPEMRRHASGWAGTLARQEDLCSNLLRFCRSKL